MNWYSAWMNTVIDRRIWTARHTGAGYDADMKRMAAELNVMAQDDKVSRLRRARKTIVSPARKESLAKYPSHQVSMADRHHANLSSR